MSGIILSTEKLKAYEYFENWCEYCRFDKAFRDSLWEDIITNESIYNELIFYLEHHTFQDRVKIGGYSLSDLYVFQMNHFNLMSDLGKNPPECNKERMVVKAFRMLADMKSDPETYIKRLEEGKWRDQE